jgi:membrane protease YdiL (CAAX protease family)
MFDTAQRTTPGERGPGSGSRKRVGFLDVLMAFGVYFVAQVVLGAAIGFVLIARGTSPDALAALFESEGATILLLALAGAAALAGVGLVALVRRRGWGMFGLRRVSAKWLLLGAGAVVLGYVANVVIFALYAAVTGDASDPQEALKGAALGTAPRFALLVLLGGVLVPFTEELLFRGLLYAWLRRWGVPLAVVASALVFGLFHGFSVVFFTAAFLGMISALLYEKSGSLWPSVVMHSLNNTLAFALSRLLV